MLKTGHSASLSEVVSLREHLAKALQRLLSESVQVERQLSPVFLLALFAALVICSVFSRFCRFFASSCFFFFSCLAFFLSFSVHIQSSLLVFHLPVEFSLLLWLDSRQGVIICESYWFTIENWLSLPFSTRTRFLETEELI